MRCLLLFGLLLAACQSHEAIPVQWSARLLELPVNADLTAEFNRPFEEPVEVSRRGDRASTAGCPSAIELLAQGYEPVTNVDYLYLRNAALHCLILREIARAQPSARSFLTGLRVDAAAAPLLPAELEFGPGAAADGEDALVAHPPGFEQRVEILARGDFLNADGLEDWLLREESWATQGTAREVRAFLVTRDAADARLRLLRELKP